MKEDGYVKMLRLKQRFKNAKKYGLTTPLDFWRV